MGRAPTRRQLLGSGAALGAAVVLGPRLLGAARPAGAAQASANSPLLTPLADPDMSFQALFALGAAGQGAAEYGEVATVLAKVQTAGETFDAFYDEFVAMSDRLRGLADESRRGRHLVSARDRYLRSARYLTPALYFVLGTSTPTPEREAETCRGMRSAWASAARLSSPRIEPVRIPFGSSTLPGWFLRPSGASGARPTVILNNGNDAQVADIYSYGAAAAVARGYNALIFEGPGQGSMLFLRRTSLRPDWNTVLTPVVDYVRGRDDVDRDRIAVIGWSEGGELVAQALMTEHRLAAAVFDPGNDAENAAFHLPESLVSLVQQGDRAAANAEWDAIFPTLPASTQFLYRKGAEPFGQPDFASLVARLLEFQLTAADVGQIETPTLVTEYDQENVYPGQARTVYDALRSDKDFVTLTADVGAQLHDAPMAPQYRNEVVFDWLDDKLRP